VNREEQILRKGVPVVINSYNQSGYLANIVECFRRNHFKNIVIVDNASTCTKTQSLLQELSQQDVTVIVYSENHGPRHFHQSGMSQFLGSGYHFFTDPDLDFDVLADDYVQKMITISEQYQMWKVGSALAIPTAEELRQDLRFHSVGENRDYRIDEWEARYWVDTVEPNVYRAAIDTTLHLFNPKLYTGNEYFSYFSGLRLAGDGYTVKHLPWYVNHQLSDTDYENSHNHWNTWKKVS
jgi:glycosyltransferase involved in cell wall biosynthesis